MCFTAAVLRPITRAPAYWPNAFRRFARYWIFVSWKAPALSLTATFLTTITEESAKAGPSHTCPCLPGDCGSMLLCAWWIHPTIVRDTSVPTQILALSPTLLSGSYLPRVLRKVGHMHQRMCREHGDLSANVLNDEPLADWDAKGVTWQAFEYAKPALAGGLSSRYVHQREVMIIHNRIMAVEHRPVWVTLVLIAV